MYGGLRYYGLYAPARWLSAAHSCWSDDKDEDIVTQTRLFQGRLRDLGLIELLQGITLDSKSGALKLTDANSRRGIVYIDQGAIVGAQEFDSEALTLGMTLQQLQLATQQQMDHAFKLQTQDALGKRIGERLIDLRIITPQQLDRGLRTQTLWTIRELALWNDGDYVYQAGERMPADVTVPRIDPSHAIMETLRYRHEWDKLEYVLPEGMRTSLVMSPDLPDDYKAGFSPADWRVVTKVNTQRTVRRIATTLRMQELDVARTVGPLIMRGALQPSRSPQSPRALTEAERLGLDHFDMFTLIVRFEQIWLKCKSDADRLTTLGRFINETMAALADTYRQSAVTLAPDTLERLLEREGVNSVGDYFFRIEDNRINLDDFSSYLHGVFEPRTRELVGQPDRLFLEYRDQLERALEVAFHAINARVLEPADRVRNQEAWEALFQSLNA